MAGLTMQLALHSDKHSDKQSQVVEEETSHPIAKPHSAVVYSIVYALVGRVGFCIPQISTDPTYVQRLLTLLACDSQVIAQQVNEIAGSIVIDYKPGIMSDVQMRLYLVCLIQSVSSEVTTPEPEKIVSPSSVSETAACPSVAQEKENGYKPVETHVLSDPEFVEMRTSLESQLEWTGVCCTPELVGEGVSPKPKLEGTRKIPTPQKIDPKVKQPAKVTYSIAHAIPGRIRFRVPRIAKDSKYVQRLEALLKADPLVTGDRPESGSLWEHRPFGVGALRHRVNSAAASIVITYKSRTMSNSKKRSLSLLEQAISYLSSLIQSAASDTVVPIS